MRYSVPKVKFQGESIWNGFQRENIFRHHQVWIGSIIIRHRIAGLAQNYADLMGCGCYSLRTIPAPNIVKPKKQYPSRLKQLSNRCKKLNRICLTYRNI